MRRRARRTRREPAPRLHEDPGLQPERTVMAWGRTMMSLFVVSAVFVRWLPYYGWWMVALIAVAGAAAAGIYATQRRRYAEQSRGIVRGRIRADAAAVAWTATAVLALGTLGIAVVAR
jgi:hypothetical protein